MPPSPRPAPSAALLTGMNCANARTASKPPSRRSFTPPPGGFARPLRHRRQADLARTRQRPLHSSMQPRTRFLSLAAFAVTQERGAHRRRYALHPLHDGLARSQRRAGRSGRSLGHPNVCTCRRAEASMPRDRPMFIDDRRRRSALCRGAHDCDRISIPRLGIRHERRNLAQRSHLLVAGCHGDDRTAAGMAGRHDRAGAARR
jgi:hypothetical protein